MSHKQEQLDQINSIEKTLKEEYNDDFQMAFSQCQSGKYGLLTKDELDMLPKKKQIQQSLDESQTIFNIYKQFHINQLPVEASSETTNEKVQEAERPEKVEQISVVLGYKTRLCKWYQRGKCTYAACSFAHGKDEIGQPIKQVMG